MAAVGDDVVVDLCKRQKPTALHSILRFFDKPFQALTVEIIAKQKPDDKMSEDGAE